MILDLLGEAISPTAADSSLSFVLSTRNSNPQLRFSERNLVIRCANDDEHDRWYKALDMVRFQPLPYEVGPKEVPVPQIVPPIVPRMPVSDQPEEEVRTEG